MPEAIEIEIILPACSDDPLSEMLRLITAAIEERKGEVEFYGLGGEHGYGSAWDTPVFSMRRFNEDAECDCGARERGDAWHKSNQHSGYCFREILKQRFAEYDERSGYNATDAASRAPECMEYGTEETPFGTIHFSRRTVIGEKMHEKWCKAHDAQRDAHERITNELYDEFGLSRALYQWHCSCGVEERVKAYFASEGAHSTTCALELPNFRHHASGFEVRWYKYIGRDNETVNQPADLTPIFRDCIADIRAASVGRNPTGEDRADGLRRNDEHAVAATGGETPDPSSTNPGADNGLPSPPDTGE